MTPCRECGRSLRYEGLGLEKSPKFLFADAPCCDASASLLEVAQCGIANPDINRVAGGSEASSENNLPWQCAIMKTDPTSTTDTDNLAFTGCAATLISCSPGILVTAASCFQKSGVTVIAPKIPNIVTTNLNTYPQVSCGRLDLHTTATTNLNQQKHFINKDDFITIHPDFNPTTLENDIALIRVLGDFDCGTATVPKPNVFPACLPKAEKFGDVSNWVTTIVSGWGSDASTSTTNAAKLKYAKVAPMDDADNNKLCSDELTAAVGGVALPLTIDDKVVCVNPDTAATGTPLPGASCFNDQGGPLVTKTTGDAGFTLVGVISLPSCDEDSSIVPGANVPSVHTEVKHYLDWITVEAKKLIEMS